MANSLSFVLSRLGLPFLFTFILCNFTDPTTKSTVLAFNNKRLSMRLIHGDSIVSHRPTSDRIKSDIARRAYLKAEAKGVSIPNEDRRSGIISGSISFFVNISIGTPPIPQLVILDTGSSLLWVQCEPCKNRKSSPYPIYDPLKSSSYKKSSCQQDYCSTKINGFCDEDRECAYMVIYGDGATNAGVVGYESLTFETSDDGLVVVPEVVFGCGRDNYEKNVVPKSTGVFGLNADDASILRSSAFKNSPKFSYCLGNVSDPEYTSSLLVLGNESILQGQETPADIRNGHFYVSLEGIKVGETELEIDKEEYQFNVIIDSGTTFNYFHRSTYELIKTEVRKILDPSFSSVNVRGDYLCYRGYFRRDLLDFPTVTFRLANETLIELDVEGFFHQGTLGVPDIFCLAVTVGDHLPLIGLLSQQYYNVGFDIDAEKVHFQSIDCRFLDS